MNVIKRIALAAVWFCAQSSVLADSPPGDPLFEVAVNVGGDIFDAVYDNDRQRLYISVPERNEVVLVSTENYEITDRLFVGSSPNGLFLGHDGARLFAALNDGGAVSALDLETKDVEEILVAHVIGNSRVFDVFEALPEKVFVSANPTTNARIGMIDLEADNEIVVVANDQSIHSHPMFDANLGEGLLYIGNIFSPRRIYKLDLNQENAPIVLQSQSGAIDDLMHMELSPAGTHIVASSGQVFDTQTLEQIAQIGAGVPSYGSQENIIYIGFELGFIQTWDTSSFSILDQFYLQCSFEDLRRLIVLPEDSGWLMFGDDKLCGLVPDLACSGAPPASTNPDPSDQSAHEPLKVELSWTNPGAGCQTTYEVVFDTDCPPLRTICHDSLERRCDSGSLEPNTTYYWQVEASNDAGTSTSPIWSFTTDLIEVPALGEIEINIGDHGFDMVHDAMRQELYVSIPERNEIVIISTVNYEILDRRIIGSSPRGIFLSLDGTELYAALNQGGAVGVLGLNSLEVQEIVVAHIIGDWRLHDVFEGLEQRVFVSATPFSSAHAHIGMIKRDENNEVVAVGSNKFIKDEPTFEVSPDGEVLYIGTSTNKINKLNLTQDDVPFITDEAFSTLLATSPLEIAPDGARLYLRSGQVVRTTPAFIQAGVIAAGPHQFGADEQIVYAAYAPDIVESYDTETFAALNQLEIPCNLDEVRRLIVLPGDSGWLILGDNKVCGLASDLICAGPPPVSTAPLPEDQATDTPLQLDLEWTNPGTGCQTTYDVAFGTNNPPNSVVCHNIAERRCSREQLSPNTTYYWRVLAKNESGMMWGSVWSFTTGPPDSSPLADVLLTLDGDGFDMEYDQSRHLLYLSLPELETIAIISTQSYEVVGQVNVPGQPFGIGIGLDGARLFAALREGGGVAIIDLDNYTVEIIHIGDVIGDDRIYDVLEATPERVFVSANPRSSGSARIGMIKLDQNNEIVIVADQQQIDSDPTFAASPQGDFLYVGENSLVGRLYQLDLSQEQVPIVSDEVFGPLGDASPLEIAPDGQRLYLFSGQVVRVAPGLVQAGVVPQGPHQFGMDDDVVFVAHEPNELEAYDATTFAVIRHRELPCNFAEVRRLVVLAEDRGWLVLGDDRICGLVRNEPPVAQCQDITASADPNCLGNVVGTDVDAGSFDPDPGDILTFSLEPPTPYPLGATDVILTVTDGLGGSDSCSATITVVDGPETPPMMSCPPDIVVACDQPTDPTSTGFASAVDNCDPKPEITYVDVDDLHGCSGTGTITRIWTATDHTGDNSSSCAQIITVTDTIPPEILCPDDLIITSGESTDPMNTGIAMATDSCDASPMVSYDNVISTPACPGDPLHFIIERSWIATDACGNIISCMQTIGVERKVAGLIIKQGVCPAPLNPAGNGIVRILLTGDGGLDVEDVIISSLRLSRADCVGASDLPNNGPPGPPIMIQDQNQPPEGKGPCACGENNSGDGIDDLSLPFTTSGLSSALLLHDASGLVELILTGETTDGSGFAAGNCIVIVPPGIGSENAFKDSNAD